MEAAMSVAGLVSDVGLVDHHCHGVVTTELERDSFELLATESDWPPATGTTVFDSPIGLAIRSLCAPLLDLPRHADADAYWKRRLELGHEDVARRLLRATGIDLYLVDTGFASDSVHGPEQLAAITGAKAREIVRLERLAETVATATTAEGFADDVDSALAEAAASAVGFKTIIAYRHGLDFDPARPTRAEVTRAAGEWLAGHVEGRPLRIDHPVLLRHLLWRAVDTAKPLQIHVGYGDPDIVLHRCDPSLMTGFIRATRTSGAHLMLLHCYPFVREAGYLAQVYPHVFIDTGLAVSYTAWSSHRLIQQSLEVAPFGKVLFASDAFGLPELYACGALLWRRGIMRVFDEWIDHDEISTEDAERYIGWIASENAIRAYALREAS